jgi:hypothetical protein
VPDPSGLTGQHFVFCPFHFQEPWIWCVEKIQKALAWGQEPFVRYEAAGQTITILTDKKGVWVKKLGERGDAEARVCQIDGRQLGAWLRAEESPHE